MSQPIIDSRVMELEERLHRERRLANVLANDTERTGGDWMRVLPRLSRHADNAREFQRRLEEITKEKA